MPTRNAGIQMQLTLFPTATRNLFRTPCLVVRRIVPLILSAFLISVPSMAQSGIDAAMDTQGLAWEANGRWLPQTEITSDGVDALASGGVGDGGSAELGLEVAGPAKVRFQWKVSSEEGFDLLSFSVNSQVYMGISGEVDWTWVELELPSGIFFLNWSYAKDEDVADGLDTAWIDTLQILPIEVPLAIFSEPGSLAVQVGKPAQFRVQAEGTGELRYQWYHDNAEIDGATRAVYQIPAVTADDAGEYFALVSDGQGVVQSQTALLTVRDAGIGGGQPGTGDRWTIMVYGHGDHNLSYSLLVDMLEMEQAGSGPGFNIVLQSDFDASDTGFRDFAVSSGIPVEFHAGLTRYLVGPDADGNPATFDSKPVAQLPESMSMDSADTLSDFVSWSASQYPADRYGIIFWNHGAQWPGFGGDTDDATGYGGGMTTAVIRGALRKAMEAQNIGKFEFVTFDTCLMGGAEVLTDFTDLCEVFIANAELDYGDGLEYGGELNLLKNDPGMDIREFGRREVPIWNRHHSQSRADLALKVHSAYDLKKFAAFSEKLNRFASQLIPLVAADSSSIARIQRDSTHYSINDIGDINEATGFVDLGEFADRLASQAGAKPSLITAARELSGSIDAMTLAMATGSLRSGKVHGLSIYYPVAGNPGEAEYDRLAFHSLPGSNWNLFLNAVAGIAVTDITPPSVVVGTPAEIPAVSPDSPLNLGFGILDGDDAMGYYASLVSNEETGDSNEYVFLGEIATGRLTGQGDYGFEWDARLPVMSGSPGDAQPYLGGWFQEVGSELLFSYADYTPPGGTEPTEVVLITQITGDSGKIVQVMDSADDALSAKPAAPLLAGGKLTPLYYTELRMGEDRSAWETYDVYFENGFIVVPEGGFAGIQIELLPVFPGLYNVEVVATDAVDNESAVVTFQVNARTDAFFTDAQPKVSVAREGPGGIRISWPFTEGFLLQFSGSVAGDWMAVDPWQVQVDADQNATFSAEATGDARFFRLINTQ